ncbi:uncharacterized protein LOC141855083 isoform X1 [Brevipalpus obovatus]|uniref:uncharacterized protein LOC141855083 isoform X1 n=1 Tax=Brevipalpus obovatus TaxID=246614 RepID=UPI003D9DEF8B
MMKPVSEMAFHQTEEPIYCNLIDEENDLDLDSRLERLRVTATGATSDDIKCQKTTDPHRKDILTTIDEIGDLDFEQELIAEERELEKIGNRSYNNRQLEAQFSPNNLRFHSYKLIKQLDPLSSSRSLFDSSSLGTQSSIRSNPSSKRSGSEREKSVKNYGRVKSWGMSFDNLLKDPIGVAIYTKFLKQEFSVENINFWLGCEKFKKLTKKNEIKKEAKIMFDCYLSINGAQPVNVDSLARTTVQKAFNKPTKNLFDIPQSQVYNLMKNDSYKRFLKSELFEKCLESEKTGKPLPVCSSDDKESTAKNVPSYPPSSSSSTTSSKRRLSLSNWFPKRSSKI